MERITESIPARDQKLAELISLHDKLESLPDEWRAYIAGAIAALSLVNQEKKSRAG